MRSKQTIFSTLSSISLVLLVSLSSMVGGDLTSRHSESQYSTDDKYVSYSELADYIDKFTMASIKRYREFHFDPQNYQVIVAARDYIIRLSLVDLHLLESSEWESAQNVIFLCGLKGQSFEKCKNHITLLHAHGDNLIACGTNAFKPICSWRRLSNLNEIQSTKSGNGLSVYDPDFAMTSLMTQDGGLYVGAPLDFVGYDSAFLRSNGMGFRRTKYDDPRWLFGPKFVASFETEEFVYTLFRETAIEHMNSGPKQYSRIGRVCKNDPGGIQKFKHYWTTFLKARLNCSLPGSPPFYYDQLQSATYLQVDQMLYAVFTTDPNHQVGSAVCAFNMPSIKSSFDGPFKDHNNANSISEPVTNNKTNFQCAGDGKDGPGSQNSGLAAEKDQLIKNPVQPIDFQPLVTIDNYKLGHIAVDIVDTRQSGRVHVMFVAAKDNTIRKYSVIKQQDGSSKTCLLEILQLFPSNSSNIILNMKFLKETTSLYLGTDNEVLRIAVDRCDRYKTRLSCLKAKDPYCGWDNNILECTTPPGQNTHTSSWIQEVIDCQENIEPGGVRSDRGKVAGENQNNSGSFLSKTLSVVTDFWEFITSVL